MMLLQAVAVALLFLATPLELRAEFVKSGFYDCIMVRKVQPCECTSPQCIKMDVKVRDSDEGPTITGNWETAVAFDDDTTTTRATFYKWDPAGAWRFSGNGSWENPCERMAMIAQDVLNELAAASGFQPRCPIPPGKYNLKNYSACLNLENFPASLYGNFKYTIEVFHKSELVGCFTVETEITPARKKKIL